jgi:hypothetical protein
MTTVNITNTATPPAEADITVAIAETLATVDTLITRAVALSREAARLRLTLAELGEEKRLKEAVLLLGVEGRNESERQARLRLELAGDGDYRRLTETERDTRSRLAETEARLWASRMKVHTCLARLKLAGGADAEGDVEETWRRRGGGGACPHRCRRRSLTVSTTCPSGSG